MNKEEPEKPKNVALFNEALLQLQRLHDSKKICTKHRRDGNFEAWRYELDIIWDGMYGQVLQYDDEKVLKTYDNLETELEKTITSKNFRKLYLKLREIQRFLEEVAAKTGLSGKMVSTRLDEIDE